LQRKYQTKDKIYGQNNELYKYFDTQTINKYIIKTDLDKSFESCWNKVITGAPKYYAGKENIDREMKELIKD